MSSNAVPQLAKFAAWPLTTLHPRPNAPVQGFIMPTIGGKEIHVVYGVHHRQKEFPSADWRFLIHAAMNCAIAFDVIHQAGFVIADVNQKNVVVSQQAKVGVLDCDSFQMNANGHLFRCEVGVAEYTPPELQGRPFKGVVRTQNHDLFGLAVHLFHLLFMGRHPFMGRFRGGDKSLQDAIAECRFVYGRDAGKAGMQAPPHSLPLALVPPDIAGKFDLAFSEGATRGGRPAAQDWHTAMGGLLQKLKSCSTERSHVYSSHLGACPWCTVVDAGGPLFFVTGVLGTLKFVCGVDELTRVCRAIEEATKYSFIRPVAGVRALQGRPLRAEVIKGRRRVRVASVATVAAAAILVLSLIVAAPLFTPLQSGVSAFGDAPWWTYADWRLGAVGVSSLGLVSSTVSLLVARTVSQYGVERRSRGAILRNAEAKRKDLHRRWDEVAANYSRKYSEVRRRLDGLRAQYLALQPAFDEEMMRLEKEKEQIQFRAYLDDQYIERAKIPKIGDGRKAILRGYSIETALDVIEHANSQIHGFGPGLRRALLTWAEQVGRGFRFDPRRGIPESERRNRVVEYRRRQAQLEVQFRKGAADLRGLTAAAERLAQDLTTEILAAERGAAQATADWSVFGKAPSAAVAS